VIIRFAVSAAGVVLSSVIIGKRQPLTVNTPFKPGIRSESRGGECSGDVIISDDEICELNRTARMCWLS